MLEFKGPFGRLSVFLVVGCFVVGLATGLPAQSAPPANASPDTEIPDKTAEAEKSEFDLAANLESFDEVWSTIDKVHWDEDRVGQTWDEARDKYRPQVESAESVAEVRKILNAMIEELGQSHFGIIAASAYDVVGDDKKSGDGDTGISFRSSDGNIFVSSVRPGSSADEAGVQPGWVVESIGDKQAADLNKKMQAAAKGPMRFETLVGLVVPKIASGTVGETKQIVLRDGEGATRELELELESKPGKKASFGHLPPIHVDSATKTLPGNVGYYRFSAFLDPSRIMKEFREAIRDEKHSEGVVIDLRGNIGGLGAMTMGMASEFSDKNSTLGFMTTKGNKLKFFVTENYDPVDGPVAVLIDECSISSAEIFSGGLQDLKLARLFGARTAGLALPSTVVKLPNGDGFQYAIANYHSASGKTLEKDGVTPDEEIPLTYELLLNDPDPVLSRALEWIQQQKSEK